MNGFSFVKNSRKYYDDASQVLTEIMMATVRKEQFDPRLSTRAPLTQPITKVHPHYTLIAPNLSF